MVKENITVLIVDDEQGMRWVLRTLFEENNYTVITAKDGIEALRVIKKQRPDLMISDMKMPKMDGMELLERSRMIQAKMPVIMITAFSEIQTAVKAMKLGAYDYVVKPFNNEELLLSVQRALKGRMLEEEVDRLRKLLDKKTNLQSVMGHSEIIKDLILQISRVAASDFSVLIQGESGSGKELVAEAIHLNSNRSSKPFVIVDCGAIPETLIESELFGYEKGAFTGAHKRKPGLFEEAHGGTLFLDEIGNLPLSMQPKLLRAIESKTVTHLGGTKKISVNIRVISATNRNLIEGTKKGDFREDLYYRLNEFFIEVPPLRKRKEDIPFLSNIFLKNVDKEVHKKVDGFSRKAEQLLLTYNWPGNVRELKNIIRRAALIADRKITPNHFPEEIQLLHNSKLTIEEIGDQLGNGMTWKEIKKFHLEELEKKVLSKVLSKTSGNKRQAAQILQMDYKTLHTKVKELNL